MKSGVLGFLDDYSVILASGSPRRRELLTMLGIDFKVRPLEGANESYPDTLDALEVAPYLSVKKAEYALKSLCKGEMIITADTVVVCDGCVLGKPHDEADARRMLRMLSDKTHTVVTGVTVATADRLESARAMTEVTFAPLSDSEINEYVSRYRPLDKAGAYGIQEWIGAIAVSRISGSYYNVMGLPLHVLYRLLLSFR